jgi:hypothetical protein
MKGASGSSSNYPAPRHAGPVEWIRDQFAKLSNRRTARGAYEEAGESALGGGAARRGRGAGAEDDAWDTRVGNEDSYAAAGPGYSGYEEQELGLAPTPGLHNEAYGGGRGYADTTDGRGRSGNPGGLDPFGDQNEAPSLRSISPRPEGDGRGGHTKGNQSLDTQGSGDGNSSPTSQRKSVFREQMS